MARCRVSDSDFIGCIEAYAKEHGFGPTMRDIAAACGLSVSAVSFRMKRLRRQGEISYEDRIPRSVRVNDGSDR